ncbi:MAG: FecR domain-containing protein [Deltaproteobacteria bacterium]|nr:FecR domain-containing protein [Deltaproteobacteria bacterium]
MPSRLPFLAAVVALAGLAGCREKEPPPDWLARLTELSGEVRAAPPGGSLARARKGEILRLGSELETGQASHALLELRSGGQLRVDPDSRVLFRDRRPGVAAALALERGAVEGTASAIAAADLVIGVGQRSIRLAGAARARVQAGGDGRDPNVEVVFGTATVEGPSGAQERVIAGRALELSVRRRDAGVPRTDARAGPVVVAREAIFYVRSTGGPGLLVKTPGAARAHAVRSGQQVKVPVGTVLTLRRAARALVGSAPGEGVTLSGPGLVTVRGAKEGDPEAAPSLEPTAGDLRIVGSGKPGLLGAPLLVEGVTVQPEITHRRMDLRLRRERGRATLSSLFGRAVLKAGPAPAVALEAGQQAVLGKGRVQGPHAPQATPLQVRQGGTVRVFVSGPSTGVTFRWNTPQAARGALVQVGPSPSFGAPLFEDVIRRDALTIPEVRRGTLHWQVQPVGHAGETMGDAVRGRLVIVPDTSHQLLKSRRSPSNTIHESDGNTTVYYQNTLPRFTFRWNPMAEARSYQVKIFREQNLREPSISTQTSAASLALKPGQLGEGAYFWYVAGRDARGELIRTTTSHRIGIAYDNAAPDLQIIYPGHGASVSEETLEVRGVALRGSRLFVNGAPAELDESSRFRHPVALKPGVNVIVFRVVDSRRGSSYYQRRVLRR